MSIFLMYIPTALPQTMSPIFTRSLLAGAWHGFELHSLKAPSYARLSFLPIPVKSYMWLLILVSNMDPPPPPAPS